MTSDLGSSLSIDLLMYSRDVAPPWKTTHRAAVNIPAQSRWRVIEFSGNLVDRTHRARRNLLARKLVS